MSEPKSKARTDLGNLIAKWGAPIDHELLVLALTHRSFAYEAGGIPTNERLEFLGDAVLEIIVTDYLFRNFPDHPEQHLSKMRSATVSQEALAIVARQVGIGDFILLGVGEDRTGGREKDSILSDAFEAMLGATYLCHGIEKTSQVALKLLKPLLEEALLRGAHSDWKTTLQGLCKDFDLELPEYLVEHTGPDHQRTFYCQCLIDGKLRGKGQGPNKKGAENQAAKEASLSLRAEHGIEGPVSLDA